MFLEVRDLDPVRVLISRNGQWPFHEKVSDRFTKRSVTVSFRYSSSGILDFSKTCKKNTLRCIHPGNRGPCPRFDPRFVGCRTELFLEESSAALQQVFREERASALHLSGAHTLFLDLKISRHYSTFLRFLRI